MRPILLTGFGPFLDVLDNPSGRLVEALDGDVVDGVPVVGEVIPVTYARGPSIAIERARQLDARLVIGFGVASNRRGVWVESSGRRVCGGSPDTDGVVLDELGDGPDRVAASVDVQRLADALGAEISEDAGGYVCNAWAWTVPQALGVPAVFVHLPTDGIDPEVVRRGLKELLRQPGDAHVG